MIKMRLTKLTKAMFKKFHSYKLIFFTNNKIMATHHQLVCKTETLGVINDKVFIINNILKP